MSPLPRVDVADVVLTAVRFNDETARVPVAWSGAPLALVGPRHLVRGQKAGAPAWSPAVYAAGAARGKRGVTQITALVLDFDHLSNGDAEAVWARLRERGWAWVAHSSFGHLAQGPEDNCFRLVVLVSRPIAPEEYEAVWTAADDALGRRSDRKARDLSRLWFVATCPPEREGFAWVRSAGGRPLDVDGAARAAAQQRARQASGPASPPAPAEGPIPAGGRNSALTSVAGGLRRKGADRDGILRALVEVNAARCNPPLPEAELARIADSVARYPVGDALVTANRTDLGNAERFEAYAGQRLRFVFPWCAWMHFDGARWVRDADGEALRAARDTLRATAAQAAALPDPDERVALIKHATDGEAIARVNAMLSLAQPLLPVSPDRLDADPDLLTCANGTIDLRSGLLRAHDRADLITRRAPVAFDPQAACPRWEAFLDRVLGGSAALQRFVQRAVGYTLTGHTREQVLFLLYGVGANGKSTFLETLRAALGEYSAVADFNTFQKREGDGARNDLARLAGARLVSAVEAEAGRPLAEALVKQLTGGDTITARFLFREFFDFKPVFKLWLAANHKPPISGGDHGIWRRIRLIPFTVTIPEAERDPRLGQKLQDELPGVLAWAVRGCLAWRAEGLGAPPEVEAATASYRSEMDALGPFLDECAAADPGHRLTARALYEAYEHWCAANGERAKSQKAFAMGLRERGFEAVKGGKGVRCWEGLRLRTDEPAGGGWRVGGANSGNSPPNWNYARAPSTAAEENEADRTLEKYPGSAPPNRLTPPQAGGGPGALPLDAYEEGEL
jgi:putative DNA primase/helicase